MTDITTEHEPWIALLATATGGALAIRFLGAILRPW
jgi:hypothetical protein